MRRGYGVLLAKVISADVLIGEQPLQLFQTNACADGRALRGEEF